MKQISSFLLLLSLSGLIRVYGQRTSLDLPLSTLIPHYSLSVSYNTTTVLLFAAPVKPVDRGDRDIIAQKQVGAENVLKLKAARRDFSQTNLHVFTADGRLYAFDITYTDAPATTHDLSRLIVPGEAQGNTQPVELSSEPVNSDEMAHYLARLKALPASEKALDRHDRMKMRLETIGLADNLLFFRLKITNLSEMDYSIDFTRLHIRDAQKAKRTSVQEKEVLPVFEDTTVSIPGHQSITRIIVVPAFTLPDKKQFLIDVFEKNGGRSLSIRLKNRQLLKVIKL